MRLIIPHNNSHACLIIPHNNRHACLIIPHNNSQKKLIVNKQQTTKQECMLACTTTATITRVNINKTNKSLLCVNLLTSLSFLHSCLHCVCLP